MQWKRRLYAFFLRRILGPYLTASSRAQLVHESVDVEVTEGKYLLRDVEFDMDSLQSLFSRSMNTESEHLKFQFQRMSVRVLEIQLALIETNNDSLPPSDPFHPITTTTVVDTDETPYYSYLGKTVGTAAAVMRKMYRLGSSTVDTTLENSNNISLVVHVLLQGVDIQITMAKSRPNSDVENDKHTSSSSHADSITQDQDQQGIKGRASSFIASYIEAALNSLQLNVQLSDVHLRFSSSPSCHDSEQNLDTFHDSTISMRFHSISYREIPSSQIRNDQIQYDSSSSNTSTLGIHRIIQIYPFQIDLEYIQDEMKKANKLLVYNGNIYVKFASNYSEDESNKTENRAVLEHGLDISIDQGLELCLNRSSLGLLPSLFSTVSKSKELQREPIFKCKGPTKQDDEDENDAGVLALVLKEREEALHRAMTKEVRGGVLVPSLYVTQGGNMNVTYDAFFDANDYSYSQLRSLGKSHLSEKSSNNSNTSIKASAHIKELSIRFEFESDIVHPPWHTVQGHDEAIVASIRELLLESSFSSDHFVLRVDVTEVDVSESLNGRFFTILQFEQCYKDNDDDERDVIDRTSFPLSAQIIRETSDITASIKMIASLAPLAICLRMSAISKLQQIQHSLIISEPQNALEERRVMISCVFRCTRVNIDIALLSNDVENVQEEIKKHLIHRHTLYSHSSSTLCDDEYSLQLCMENIHFSLDSCPHPSTEEEIIPSIHAKLTSLRSIVGVSLPYYHTNGRKERLVLDLIIFDSDILLDSKSILMLEYTVLNQLSKPSHASRRKWTKKYFPLITPLASVKATQNQDVRITGRGARGSDPQAVLFSDACESDRNAFMYIPNIVVDISRSDLSFLVHLLSSQHHLDEVDKDDTYWNEKRKSKNSTFPNTIAYGFRCDLVTISSHLHMMGPAENGSATESNYSYILAMDRCSLHILNQSFPRKLNIRLTLHDFSLFEAITGSVPNQYGSLEAYPLLIGYDNLCLQRCKGAKERRTQVKGVPLIFRTKVCQPLSPRTPSIIVDRLQHFDDGDAVDEQSFYFSLYDSTIRCASLDSGWVHRLLTTINLGENAYTKPKSESVEKDDRCTILKIFITISDFGVDYISPDYFRSCSSIKIRIGEIRVTSNIIKPAAPTQNVKISVSDIGLYISNERISPTHENIGVLCSNLFMDRVHGEPWAVSPKSFEEAMGKMNFVAISNVDSIDMIVTLVSPSSSEPERTTNPSNITLSIGRVSLYACRDSLRCFSDTVGELLLVLTSPQPRPKEDIPNLDPHVNKRSISMKDAMGDPLFSKAEGEDRTPDFFNFKTQQDDCKLVDTDELPSQYPFAYTSDIFNRMHADQSWTAIDYLSDNLPHGIEQVSGWYCNQDLRVDTVIPEDATIIIDAGIEHRETFKIFPQHIPHKSISSSKTVPGAEVFIADMIGRAHLRIKLKIVVTDMTLVCRFFEGYDWAHRPNVATPPKGAMDVKSKILDELLNQNEYCSSDLDFDHTRRMTDDRSSVFLDFTTCKRRQIDKFFQLQVTGLKSHVDLFQDSSEQRLSSLINISLTDFVLAERLNSPRPLKVLGEWASDKEHPRDSNDGLLMIRIVTMLPREKISSDNSIMSDEAQAVLEMLPIRCFLHQSTLKFMKDFFSYSETLFEERPQTNIEPSPPTFFQLFKVKPVKLKIDYIPDHIDTTALKNGSLIELLNLLPIEDMVLRLNPLEIRNSSGWSSIVNEIINRWLENITANQMHKFITRTSPLQPISSVGEGVKELIMLPIEEYRQGGVVTAGLCKGASDLAGIVAYETAKVTGRLTRAAAKTLDRTTKENSNDALWKERNDVRNIGITAQALESLTRGIKEANAKVLIIPYREYQRYGPKGAMKSVIKGLPVAICAPLSGAAEALSLGLQGFCDHIRPDQKHEAETNTD